MAWVEQRKNGTWRVRYRRDDGTLGSIHGFPSKRSAQQHVADLEADQRKGTWIDPAAGQRTVTDWVTDWLDALDVAVRTEDNYRSILRNHILPRWGDTPLNAITGLKAHAWAKDLRTRRSPITVASIMKL